MDANPTCSTVNPPGRENRFDRDWAQSRQFALSHSPQTQAVIIYGPNGCGKTTNAVALARYFGKTVIIDNERYRAYDGQFPPQAIVLTAARLPGAIHFDDVVYSMWRFSQPEPPSAIKA